MNKLIIASNNAHKISEIKEILCESKIDIISLKEANVNIEVEEDGVTFQENAYKKAKEIKDYLVNNGYENFMVMSDDSGLEINYLDGEPGVYSARYAGEHGNDRKNNELVLKKLKNVDTKHRGASFVCSIVVITDDGKEIYAEGRVSGVITNEWDGKDGFGYDPLFYVPEKQKTFAEMTSEEKNLISHRGIALEKIKEKLNKYI